LIEQAKGVLAATAGLSMDAAFNAIRTYARNHNQTLRNVADEVITRKIDLSQEALVKR
jgi:AmiR/NasT family two-component response regulator